MPHRFTSTLALTLALFIPAIASAAPPDDCPDGWFCEPNTSPASPSPASPSPASPSPPPLMTPQSDQRPPAQPATGPVNGAAFYPPPPPPPGAAPPEPPPSPEPRPKKRRHGFREWGFNLHLEGALLANEPNEDDAAMGGLGFGFRYRVLPSLAFEAGVDFLRGAEHDKYWRSETALLLNTLVFFNPRDVAQVYAVGGLGFSRSNLNYADRTGDEIVYKRSSEHPSYFGGHLGLGLEVRISRRIAVGGDLTGFIRTRTNDSNHSDVFNESNAFREGDTSGGVLRAGVTFYW